MKLCDHCKTTEVLVRIRAKRLLCSHDMTLCGECAITEIRKRQAMHATLFIVRPHSSGETDEHP